MIRLALNASSLLMPHTGIASYTRNLAKALKASGEVDAVFFYGIGWSDEIREAALPGAGGLRSWILKYIPRPYWLRRLGIQQRRFNRGVRDFGFALYHEPGFLPFRFDGPTVITIHDLSPLRFPETHPADRVRNINEYLPAAAERASMILVDSEFVRQEVIELLDVQPSRVKAVLLGVSEDYRPRTEDITRACLERLGLQHGRYVLAVGTLEPRKNLRRALEAHARLPHALRKDNPLVIAGAKGWLVHDLQERIHAAESRGEVRWLGYVPGDVLPILYAGARMLIYPSFYEGFGLPVLEAMASGVPVITSDRASLPEVAGEAGILVHPDDPDAMRDAMVRLIEDEDESLKRARLGIERAGRFTWQACARQTLSVYKQVLASA